MFAAHAQGTPAGGRAPQPRGRWQHLRVARQEFVYVDPRDEVYFGD
jgi:hypothetical protein